MKSDETTESPTSAEWTARISDLRRADVYRAGGKGANLGELAAAGAPVPDGYVILADAFVSFLTETGLRADVIAAVESVDVDDPVALQTTADELRKRIAETEPPERLKQAMLEPYSQLGDQPVAVRSSATAEDTAAASFAGMNETVLGVRGRDGLFEAIRTCWASLYSPRVIAYRRDLGIDEERLAIAVVVQVMVDAEWAGVMLTEHPDGAADRILIEAAPGLGDVVVGGRVTPDLFAVDKANLQIVASERGHQDHRLVLGETGIRREEQATRGPSLSTEVVRRIAELGRRIEDHYASAQDIEWAVDREGVVRILQSRPITSGRVEIRRKLPVERTIDPSGGEVLLHGVGSGFGVASGRPVIVPEYRPDAEFRPGDVLVTRMTTPDWFPLIRRASGLVTDEGGATSHAAIVARELGLPGVVGAGNATEVLAGRQRITVDGARGLVLEGDVAKTAAEPARAAPAPVASGGTALATGTSIFCNLATAERAVEIASRYVDGVGLARAETMLLEALGGRHPQLLIEQGQDREFVDAMASALETLASPFGPRPVVYRFHDFRTNEFRKLEGGERFEPVEANPMIGFRGCARYLADPSLFRLEIAAVLRVREKGGGSNLEVMLPFVRSASEIRACVALMRDNGLDPASVNVHAMAEVPSIIDNLQVLAECGFVGISIGSNDLTQLLLGVDRDSEVLTARYDARDPAVLAYLERLIRGAKDLGLHTSICGQAPSLYAGYAERLVRMGIDAISVNLDAIDTVRRRVAAEERRILLEAARHPSPHHGRH